MPPDPSMITKLLQQAEMASAQLGSTQSKLSLNKATKVSKRATTTITTTATAVPPPVLPEEEEHSDVMTSTMEHLLRNRGYEYLTEQNELAQKSKEDARILVEQGAKEFFYGKDLPPISLTQDPERYVNKVLSDNSAFYSNIRESSITNKGNTKPGCTLENTVRKCSSVLSDASSNPDTASASGTTGSTHTGRAFKEPGAVRQRNHRTLATSLNIVQKLLNEPVTRKQSIFTLSQRHFLTADFLMGDIIDALASDSREMRGAMEIARKIYTSAYSDNKCGDFLLSAEIARLKQELHETKIALEKQRQRAIVLLTAMDDRRKLDQKRAEETVKKVEEQRAIEVNAAMQRTRDYGEQVRILRAVIEAIKNDQQVKEVETLKQNLDSSRALTRELEGKNVQLMESLQTLQAAYSDLQMEHQEAGAVIMQLRAELKAANNEREYCKGCSSRIIERSKYVGSEITNRVERLEAVSAIFSGLQVNKEKLQMSIDNPGVSEYLYEKEKVVSSFFDDLRAAEKEKLHLLQQEPPDAQAEHLEGQNKGASVVDRVDESYYLIDLSKLARSLCLIEMRLEAAPKLQQLDDEITALRYENNRLKNVEQELTELRKVYRSVISRTQAIEPKASGADTEADPKGDSTKETQGASAGKIEGSHLASAQNQGIYENSVTLLREQPLQLLISKNFKIQLVEREDRDKEGSELTTTPNYVSAVILSFLRHLCMSSFTSDTSMCRQLTGRCMPKADGTPYPTTYPIQALFTGWVHAQYHIVPEDRRQFEVELLVNKVSCCLQAFQSLTSDIFIEDESMLLSLGSLLLNTSISADEVSFLIYITILTHGGLPDAHPVLLPYLEKDVKITTAYISLKRAINIILATVSKTIQKGFIEFFIHQGRSTSLIKDVTLADISSGRVFVVDVYENLDGDDLYDADIREIFAANKDYFSDTGAASSATVGLSSSVASPIKNLRNRDDLTRVSIINANFFLLSMLKAYRTEVMTRLEATRLMYAGSLLETSTLLRSSKMTALPDTMKFRIVREIIRTINPICDDSMIDAAYLDVIWRSPSANWSILVDACKTRGVFASALKFPPIEVMMPLVGGYYTGATNPGLSSSPGVAPASIAAYANDYDTILSQARSLFDKAKVALLHLSSAMGTESAVCTRSIIQEVSNIERTALTFDNLGLVISALKATLLYAVELSFSVISACGRDYGIESLSVRKSLAEGKGVSLRKVARQPTEIWIDSLYYLTGALAASLGWETDSCMCVASMSMKRKPSSRGESRA